MGSTPTLFRQFPCVRNPDRMVLREEVEVRHDPEITARGAASRHMVSVELHLKGGQRLERTVEAPRWSECKVVSHADVADNFRKLAGHVFPTHEVEELRDVMLNLDQFDDAGRIVELPAVQ